MAGSSVLSKKIVLIFCVLIFMKIIDFMLKNIEHEFFFLYFGPRLLVFEYSFGQAQEPMW